MASTSTYRPWRNAWAARSRLLEAAALQEPDGAPAPRDGVPFPRCQEKGIDVRIALDVTRMAYRHEYDVAVILSLDQDLSEVAAEIRAIAA